MRKQAVELLAGRWQVPLALVAAGVAGVALLQVAPTSPPIEFQVLLADVALFEQAGDLDAAANAVANVLELEPALSPAQQAELHDRLAGLIYTAERERPEHNLSNVKTLVQHQQDAWKLGHPPTPSSLLRASLAQQWLGNDRLALVGLRTVLAQELEPTDRRAALKATAQLLSTDPEARLERRHLLEQLLTDEGLSPGYVWWALQHAVEDALDDNDSILARRLLADHGDRLKVSHLKGCLEYLDALVMIHEGRAAEAEPVVHWIDDWLGEKARADRELEPLANLPSRNRWLMGRVHLAEQRPREALESFDEALRRGPDFDLRIAVAAGRGEALAALGGHDAALDSFRRALEELAVSPRHRSRALARFRQALVELYERQRENQDYASAIGYLSFAAELMSDSQTEQQLLTVFEQLGDACVEAADATPDEPARRPFWAQAGESYERAANLVEYNEPHLADLLWSSAESYDRAGRIASARRMLAQFVGGRSEEPRMPRALLQLGRASESLGELGPALEWYGRLIDEYPRLPEAKRGKVLRAGVLLALGADRYPEAEAILLSLLEEEHITPEAPEFHDALLRLCELLYYRGRFGEAISRLENFLTLYPDDPLRLRGRFMLAEAYRRSAAELRSAERDGNAAAASEGRRRLRVAADLFAEIVRDAEAVPQPHHEALALYERLALFYRADCLFELNEPETLEAALAAYRSAAARYAGRPAALTAHVQIANIHLRQGDVVDAARAVEKARWLLRSVPEEAFGGALAGDRAEWEGFLSTVASSDLFREVLVSPH